MERDSGCNVGMECERRGERRGEGGGGGGGREREREKEREREREPTCAHGQLEKNINSILYWYNETTCVVSCETWACLYTNVVLCFEIIPSVICL